ncbi:MAG: hypothetical protein ABSA74_00105 [Candidatus Staskawiczbacteria bacterium]|jgi:hypothetical protein
MIKSKYFFLSIFLLFFLFLNVHSIFALEVPLPGLSSSPTLPEYVIYLFKTGILLAGILSLISFAVGAVQLIASADNPQIASDGKDRMKSAILGLILTAASTVIIISIGVPKNQTVALPTVAQLNGVYYDDSAHTPAPQSDDSSNAPSGASNLTYKCSGSSAPGVLVWTFPNPGLEDGNAGQLDNVTVTEMNCGGTASIGSGSFKWELDAPGVYYCLGGCSGSMCTGYMSDVTASSADQLAAPFADNLKGVRIVNNSASGLKYGVVFHNEKGLANGGECNYPKTNTGSGAECETVDNDMKVNAIDVYALNTDSTAGNGVTFYSKPTGWNTDSGGHRAAGFYEVTNDDINNGKLSQDNSSATGSICDTSNNTNSLCLTTGSMCFNYAKVDVPDAYKKKCSNSSCGNENQCQTENKNNPNYCNGVCCSDGSCQLTQDQCPNPSTSSSTCDCGPGQPQSSACCLDTSCSDSACETFEDCPGSVEIKGSYLVGIYSEDLLEEGGSGSVYCQTFRQTVPNLNVQEIIAQGSAETGQVYIIPTQ